MRVGTNVRRYFLLLFAWIFALSVAHAAVCDPRAFHGAYGFSLTGTTTIGGPARPVAVVGRGVVDDSGNLSGISSASFTGLIFGNQVTGRFEAQTDCAVRLTLQDDTGNFQHFAGTMSADGGHVAFRQTDPGGARERHSAPDHEWVFRIQPGWGIQGEGVRQNRRPQYRSRLRPRFGPGRDDSRRRPQSFLRLRARRTGAGRGNLRGRGRLLRDARPGVAGGRAQNRRDALPRHSSRQRPRGSGHSDGSRYGRRASADFSITRRAPSRRSKTAVVTAVSEIGSFRISAETQKPPRLRRFCLPAGSNVRLIYPAPLSETWPWRARMQTGFCPAVRQLVNLDRAEARGPQTFLASEIRFSASCAERGRRFGRAG